MLRKTLLILLVLDLLFWLLHLALGFSVPMFNLDVEYNFPTYYQGIKIFVLGISLIHLRKYIFLGLITIGLALDEIFVFHENFPTKLWNKYPEQINTIIATAVNIGYRSSTWIIFYIPIFLIILFYYFSQYRRLSSGDRAIINLSILLFTLVLALELINSRGVLTPVQYHHTTSLEELAEMLGITNLFRLLTWNRTKFRRK